MHRKGTGRKERIDKMLKRKSVVGKRQLNRRVARGVTQFVKEIANCENQNILESNLSENNLSICYDLDSDQESMYQQVEPDPFENFLASTNSDHVTRVDTINNNNSVSLVDNTNKCDLRSSLAHWASVKHKVPQNYVNDLLHILSPYHKNLPLDCRTLLKTSVITKESKLDNGTYRHMGLRTGLNNILTTYKINFNENIIKLSFNIDGLPLFKSNKLQFWPILCLIKNVQFSRPFIVGIFFGTSKPAPLKDFLDNFVVELGDLLENGFSFGNTNFQISVHSFVCDAPARAYLKCVKGHTGYSACDKCEEVGEFHGRVVLLSTKSVRRTDESFKLKSDEDYHLSDSPLMELGIGMVSTFPIDYMHCICIGVTKKLLLTWISGSLSVRLHNRLITQISEKLLSIRCCIPLEFNRKPRSLSDLSYWKATELRTFLVYAGPVVLESYLDISVYENFLLLHCAVTILLSATHISTFGADFAGSLLDIFVNHSKKIYGKEFIIYNVHMLCHLHEDVKIFGPLDQFSCFPFENFLGQLKGLVRSPVNPLAQVYRRLSEENNFIFDSKDSGASLSNTHLEHMTGPVIENIAISKQFKKLVHNTVVYFSNSYKSSDSYFISKTGKIVQIENIIVTSNNKTVLLGREFLTYKSFYNYPIESSLLGIYVVKDLSEFQIWDLVEIKSKCLIIPSNRSTNDLVCFPLVHSIN